MSRRPVSTGWFLQSCMAEWLGRGLQNLLRRFDSGCSVCVVIMKKVTTIEMLLPQNMGLITL
jgi:hypothetical protein